VFEAVLARAEDHMSMPDRLFRYFPPEASDVLSTAQFWFSRPSDFNDPFEMLPRHDAFLARIAQEFLKGRSASLPPDMAAKVARQWVEDAMEVISAGLPAAEFNRHLQVVCFSANGSNLLMWAHYAKCHTGFVVEFDPTRELFSRGEFRKVEYSAIRPSIENKEDHYEISFTKSAEWGPGGADEAEYRLIMPVPNLLIGKRRGDKEEGRRYIPLPLDSVKAVYFGCRMNPEGECARELLQSLKLAGRGHIKPFVMHRDHSAYRLVPLPWAEWKPLAADIVKDFEGRCGFAGSVALDRPLCRSKAGQNSC
jgi:hypothetical protein